MNRFLRVKEENVIGDTYINKNKIKLIVENENSCCEVFFFSEDGYSRIVLEENFADLKNQLTGFLEVTLLSNRLRKKKHVKALINLDNILSIVEFKNGTIFRTRIPFSKKLFCGVLTEESFSTILFKIKMTDKAVEKE